MAAKRSKSQRRRLAIQHAAAEQRKRPTPSPPGEAPETNDATPSVSIGQAITSGEEVRPDRILTYAMLPDGTDISGQTWPTDPEKFAHAEGREPDSSFSSNVEANDFVSEVLQKVQGRLIQLNEPDELTYIRTRLQEIIEYLQSLVHVVDVGQFEWSDALYAALIKDLYALRFSQDFVAGLQARYDQMQERTNEQ